ncbi:unnamed protein product [Calypogeia fissa]
MAARSLVPSCPTIFRVVAAALVLGMVMSTMLVVVKADRGSIKPLHGNAQSTLLKAPLARSTLKVPLAQSMLKSPLAKAMTSNNNMKAPVLPKSTTQPPPPPKVGTNNANEPSHFKIDWSNADPKGKTDVTTLDNTKCGDVLHFHYDQTKHVLVAVTGLNCHSADHCTYVRIHHEFKNSRSMVHAHCNLPIGQNLHYILLTRAEYEASLSNEQNQGGGAPLWQDNNKAFRNGNESSEQEKKRQHDTKEHDAKRVSKGHSAGKIVARVFKTIFRILLMLFK